jgi:hypothetical protein
LSRFLPLLLLFAVSCGKKEEPQAKKIAPAAAMHDRSKPFLTDARLASLVKAAKDHPDLARAFPLPAGASTPKEGLQRLDERDAEAAKYGFTGYDEFAEVRTRANSARSCLKSAEDLEPKIRELEAKLAKPDLTDSQRKLQQEMVDRTKSHRDNILKFLPAEDLETYRRNRAAVDAVLK